MGTKKEAVVDNPSKVVQVITLPHPIILKKTLPLSKAVMKLLLQLPPLLY